jgi:hypothetical protein
VKVEGVLTRRTSTLVKINFQLTVICGNYARN